MCGVARRHGLTPQQLFTWRREARPRDSSAEVAGALFVPAVLDASSEPTRQRVEHRSVFLQASIELEIDGVTVRIGRDAPATTIAAVLRALKAGA